MATSKTSKAADDAIKSLGPLAELLNKTAGDLWKIFVWRYIAIGISSLVVAILGMGYLMFLLGARNWWLMLPFPFFLGLVYWSLQNLINPYYPAMDNVIEHVKGVTRVDPAPVEVVRADPKYRIG